MDNEKQKKEILKTLEFLQQQKQTLTSWSITWLQGRLLSELVSLYSPKKILELGTSVGFSTLWMAYSMSDLCSLTTIEIDPRRYFSSKEIFLKLSLGGRINSLEGDFFKISGSMEQHGPYDFVFIDALQPRYLEVIEFLRSSGFVSSNCVFVCDNINSHSYMDVFVEKISSQATFCELLDIDSGFLVFSFN